MESSVFHLHDMLNYAITLLLFTFVTVCVWLIYRKSQKQLEEKYTNQPYDGVNRDYLNAVYAEKGIEACSILSGSNYMSSNYVDTLRFRKWKPLHTDPDYQLFATTQSNNEYCYFFMDDDKQMLKTNEYPNGYAPVVDPLAKFSECSKLGNDLFKNTSVITNVFESTGYDANHNLPYKKCIMQVDRAAASSPESIDQFWQSFGDANNGAFCQGIANTLLAEGNAYIFKRDQLHNKIQPYRSIYTSVPTLISSLNGCLATNEGLTSAISASNARLAALQQAIGASNSYYQPLLAAKLSALESLNQQKTTKTTDLVSLSNNLYHVLIPNINDVQAKHRSISTHRTTCRTNLNIKREALLQAQNAHEVLTENYRRLDIDHANCEKLLREMNGNITLQRPLRQDILEKLSNIKQRVYACNTEQNTLRIEEARLRALLNRVRNEYDKCANTRAVVEAEIARLKSQKTMLINEIEEVKRRCRDDQSNFNLATINIHRESAKEIIATEQQRCAASISLRKRKAELLNEIKGVMLRADDCDTIIARCKCKVPVAEFPWNDNRGYLSGYSGRKLNTTTGRIVEVRKHLSTAPFIRFNGQGEMYKIISTKKHKGGDSYITVVNVTGTESPDGQKTSVTMYQEV